MFRKFSLLVGVAVIALAAACSQCNNEDGACGSAGTDGAGGANDIAACIDGTVCIMQGEIDALIDRMVPAMYRSSLPAEQMAMMREQALEQLVMKAILLREADKKNITVTDADIAALLPPDVSLSDIAMAQGLSEAEITKEIFEITRIQKMVETEIGALAAPSDDEIKAYWDSLVAERPDIAEVPPQVTASHILVKVDADAAQEDKALAQEKIEGIREQLLAGEDFAELAKSLSDCPSGEYGGDLGTFGRGRMVASFEAAAFAQEAGDIGDIVTSPFGFHIIKVTEKAEAKERTWESEKDDIATLMQNEVKQERARAFIEKIRRDITITYPGGKKAPACMLGDGCDH